MSCVLGVRGCCFLRDPCLCCLVCFCCSMECCFHSCGSDRRVSESGSGTDPLIGRVLGMGMRLFRVRWICRTLRMIAIRRMTWIVGACLGCICLGNCFCRGSPVFGVFDGTLGTMRTGRGCGSSIGCVRVIAFGVPGRAGRCVCVRSQCIGLCTCVLAPRFLGRRSTRSCCRLFAS